MSKSEKKAGPGEEKNGKKKWIIVGVVAVLVLAAAVGGNKGSDQTADTPSSEPPTQASAPAESEPSTQATTPAETQLPETDPESTAYTLEHGELVSAVQNEIEGRSVLVVKAKISSSYNNKATVDQNYYNVEDLIQNQGCGDFDEIQYWAVADMSDGSERKVVSFTVGSDLIQSILDKSVAANQLGGYVDELYILPSLSE